MVARRASLKRIKLIKANTNLCKTIAATFLLLESIFRFSHEKWRKPQGEMQFVILNIQYDRYKECYQDDKTKCKNVGQICF